ncbi:kinesin motor catalytic domain protein (macronuclear) [Tetrahymena thermophila SB210]|uniref:Kinesin motor catalytic domain protein n=1 Tax=Tetrahymena thermophila (strain SB210) TaxID=312017 RepID=Q23YT2_TETTS|nr:kinesin motor catalytic domain protein [Tetrahymena thermophila SB210]EAS01723.2 kinesin motor catalytic domain protein [Tetrahymena thermophila SB210]|eukprot:XP_001021968.2 kinesin motor catalytic domain protein [Tetrahymena thermophila SB210]
MSQKLIQQDSQLELSKRGSHHDESPFILKREQSTPFQRSLTKKLTLQHQKGSLRNSLDRESVLNTSSDKMSRYGSSYSSKREIKMRKMTDQDQEDASIQDKTQISIKKYYQGSANYKIAIKIKMVPYEMKLKSSYLSIENLDPKTILLRNKPDKTKINGQTHASRDINNLQKDKIQTFDWVFGENENSEIMAVKFLQQPVINLFSGYNQSIILYGGGDSGKTHLAIGNLRDPGLIILLLKETLYHRNEFEEKGIKTQIKISICSYQNDKFYDCIIGHGYPLDIHEDSQKQLYIAGLYEVEIKTLLQGLRIIKIAQLNLQKYEQSTDKAKDLLKNNNIIFEIKCIQEDQKDIDKKKIISSLKFVKFEKETFADAIKEGSHKSVLAPLNNCLRVISEINLKTRKSNSIPLKDNKLIEYLRECIGGNSQTYLIGCANPLQNYQQDTEAMVRYLNISRSITTNPEIVRYSNKTQEYQAELYQKLIRENIQGWISEFLTDPQSLNKQQQLRLQIIGNILFKIQQILSKLLLIYSEVQHNQEQLQVIYNEIIENMSKAYTKCITSSDIKEFYIGKIQQYHIDLFKQLISNNQFSIQTHLNKLYSQKMKAEIWEQRLVQHLKLKDLREKKHDELQPKDVEKLVQISKQSKKLYQFYNEQICMCQFSYAKSQELLNHLFFEINQINAVSSLAQIPTLQQINSSQFIEIKNRKPSSIKLIEDPSVSASYQSKSSRSIKNKNLQQSNYKQLQALPSIFQQQKELSIAQENEQKEDLQSSLEISTDRKKTGKSQFLIMNILNDDNSKKNADDNLNESITQNSDKPQSYNQDASDKVVDIKQLEKKYLQKKQQREPTKFIYINSKKIEVKKIKNSKRTKKLSQEQSSINKSSINEGYDSHQNSIEKYYVQDSLNQGNPNNQIFSQDHSLISQFILNKTNEHNQNNLSILDNERYQSINQLLQPSTESNIHTLKTSNQIGNLNNNISNNQDILKNMSSNQKSEDIQQRIQSYQNNLPYLSQLLDGQIDLPSQDSILKNNQIISVNPSNQISMISSPHQTNDMKNYSSKDIIQKQKKSSFQLNSADKTLLNLTNKLELDDGILNNIFQKSKATLPNNKLKNTADQKQQQIHEKIQQEYQFRLPKNIQSLGNQRIKYNSLEKTKERSAGNEKASNSLLKQIQSPISNFNLVNKKLSLINLRGQLLYEKKPIGDDVGYFRTQLKESNNPLPKDYFYELLLKSQKVANLNKIKHTFQQMTEQSSLTNLNNSLEKKILIQESATQNSNDQLQSPPKFVKYEQEQINQSKQNQQDQVQQNTNKVDKSSSSQDIKLPQHSLTKKQDISIKNQIALRLPSISETLQRRSKYTKFFFN